MFKDFVLIFFLVLVLVAEGLLFLMILFVFAGFFEVVAMGCNPKMSCLKKVLYARANYCAFGGVIRVVVVGKAINKSCVLKRLYTSWPLSLSARVVLSGVEPIWPRTDEPSWRGQRFCQMPLLKRNRVSKRQPLTLSRVPWRSVQFLKIYRNQSRVLAR